MSDLPDCSASQQEVEEATTDTTTHVKTSPLLIPLTPIDEFPALPDPRHKTKRQESLCGISVVLGIVGVLVGATHGVALTVGFDQEKDAVAWWIVFGLIYGQALLALLCLVALLVVDPGFVERSPKTCYPLPPSIADWLAKGSVEDHRPPELYFPSLEPDCTDTFCSRCLVWRRQPRGGSIQRQPSAVAKRMRDQYQLKLEMEEETTTVVETTVSKTADAEAHIQRQESTSGEHRDKEEVQVPLEEKETLPDKTTTTTTTTSTTKRTTTKTSLSLPTTGAIRYFHCNTCQRCVEYFDHHCSFFGRCIARRNLYYFYTLIALGAASYLTCLASVLAGLLHSYPTKWVLPFFLVGVALLHCTSPTLQRCLLRWKRVVCGACR